jgi:ABC-2 type transporter
MLMSRAPIVCGDAISTGLDAASTYDMIQVILYAGRKRKQTGIFSLLQPSPETVSLFDDVIVMAAGQIIFAGPIEEVEDYFAGIGFHCPEFTDVADFLQIVSSGDGDMLYDPTNVLREQRPNPPSISELADLFRKSHFGRSILRALDSPLPYVWTEEEGTERGSGRVSNLVMSDAVRKKYANRFPRSTLLVLKRFITLWLRDRRVIIAGVVKNVLMGVSVGGAFFSTDDEVSIRGALFQAGLFIMLGKFRLFFYYAKVRGASKLTIRCFDLY